MNGPVHNLLMHFFHPGQLKNRSFQNFFFDIVTTQNDHKRYIKHVLGRIYVFFTHIGIRSGGGGSPKGLVHNLLMQFFTSGTSIIEVFETCVFDIVTTEYDHPRYVKHVLGRIHVFSTRFPY